MARPLCVQIVEKDRAARALVAHWLRSAGFSVVEGQADEPCEAEIACVEWGMGPGGSQALAEIRRATSVYCTPRKACNTYRAMLEGLLELEQDLSQHIHKENDILFPRALQLERSRATA